MPLFSSLPALGCGSPSPMQPHLPPWHLVSTFQNKRILTANYLFVSRRYLTLWVVTVSQTNRSSAPSLPLDHFPASSDNQKRVQDSLLSLCFLQLHLQNPAKKRQGETSHLPQPPGRQEQGLWWQKAFAFQMLILAGSRKGPSLCPYHAAPRGARASAWGYGT